MALSGNPTRFILFSLEASTTYLPSWLHGFLLGESLVILCRVDDGDQGFHFDHLRFASS